MVAGSPRYHTIDSLLHVIHDAITDEADQLDVSYDGEGFREFTSERVETENTHGTGCTFASAIAAGLAKGMELAATVESAKEYVTQGLRHSYGVGGGHGPLNHFWGRGYAHEGRPYGETGRVGVDSRLRGNVGWGAREGLNPTPTGWVRTDDR